jgi:DNA (cytosine-5)-methyltransferase 1
MGLVVDLFAGGGGTSLGIEWAFGRSPDIAVNHDREALAMHEANHPETKHYHEDVRKVDIRKLVDGRPVDFLWLSPDCKHHSKAKGGKPVDRKIRGLAWEAVRWAEQARPSIICLENVQEFRDWGPLGKDARPNRLQKGFTYRRFKGRLRSLGYDVEDALLRACDYGAPTTRERLFLVARCDGREIVWPEPTHSKTGAGGLTPWRTAAECIDFGLPCPSIFLAPEQAKALGVRRPLAEKTERRIYRGIDRFVINSPRPFIVSMYHDNAPNGADEPLRTITTQGNKFNLVAPVLVPRYGEREGQAPRVLQVDQPSPTIVPTQNGGSLVAAYLAKHYGGHEATGSQLQLPIDTITAKDHNALVASTVAPLGDGAGWHRAEVQAFLIKYHDNGGQWGDLFDPAPTVVANDSLGLVMVEGVPHAIVDIGMRMLVARELFRCQGFPESYRIDIECERMVRGRLVRGRLPADAQVRMVGNSVPPHLAAALAAANMTSPAKERVA